MNKGCHTCMIMHVQSLHCPGASFTKKDRTISLKMSVRSFLRSAYVGFTKTS